METEDIVTKESEELDSSSNKDSWHKPITTVTTFSKYLSLTLFVALPFLGFWFGIQYQSGNGVKENIVVSEVSKDIASSKGDLLQSSGFINRIDDENGLVLKINEQGTLAVAITTEPGQGIYPSDDDWNGASNRFSYDQKLVILFPDGEKAEFNAYELASPDLLSPPVIWPTKIDSLYISLDFEWRYGDVLSGSISRRYGYGDPPAFAGSNSFSIDPVSLEITHSNLELNVNSETGLILESAQKEREEKQNEMWKSWDY